MKKILAILLCLAMAVSFGACNSGGGASGSGNTVAGDVPADRYDGSDRTGSNLEQPLVISSMTMDGKFNSFYATSAYDVAVVGQTQITLITNSEEAEPVAGLDLPTYALSYKMEVSDDQSQTTYTFILKNGLLFSDGKPVTGKDVLFNMYEYLDPAYSGSSTLYSMDIVGLSAYRNQTEDESQVSVKDTEFGTQAQTRVDAVKAGTGTEADTAAAWAYVEQYIGEDSAVLIKYGYVPSDLGLDAAADEGFNSSAIILAYMGLISYEGGAWVAAEGSNVDLTKLATYTSDEANALTYAFAKSTMTIADYDKNAGYNVVSEEGSDLYTQLKREIAADYYKEHKTINTVSGIVLDSVKCDDGVERERLTVKINGVDPKAIWNFSFEVCPMHYYSTEALTAAADGKENFGVSFSDTAFQESIKKIVVPMGAGVYQAADSTGKPTTVSSEFFKDGIVYYTANDNFCLGAPYIKNLRYKTITAGSEIDSLKNGEVHFADPSATSGNVNKITEDTNLESVLVDNLGYGYIGMNAQQIPDLNARHAIAYALDTELALEYYTGGLADIIYRGMSQVSWAYPKDCTNMYPFDETGAKSKEAFLASANFKEVNGKVVNADGSAVKYTFTLPSNADDHPAGAIFIKAKEVLEKIGVTVNIEVDNDVLNKLNTGTIAVWAAAWQATIDPDMFQVYYSDNKVNTAESPTSYGLYWLFENGSDEEKAILVELNTLIVQGRESLNVDERKPVYSKALDDAMKLCVEIPTYQRKNMYAYNSTLIDSATLWQKVTPYKGPLAEIWKVKLK